MLAVEKTQRPSLGDCNADQVRFAAVLHEKGSLAALVVVVEVQKEGQLGEAVTKKVLHQVARLIQRRARPGAVCVHPENIVLAILVQSPSLV